MGFLDRVKSWFVAEAEEASDMLDGARDRLDTTLSAKERELAATPEEKLEALGEQIESGDDPFEEIRQKVEQTVADADADEAVEATE
ncbi:MAG: hypothetical protein HKN26_04005 [Acidimicrobiales bacterium]|nr:hypothetical protein [Acidimicrobiales bacterium]